MVKIIFFSIFQMTRPSKRLRQDSESSTSSSEDSCDENNNHIVIRKTYLEKFWAEKREKGPIWGGSGILSRCAP